MLSNSKGLASPVRTLKQAVWDLAREQEDREQARLTALKAKVSRRIGSRLASKVPTAPDYSKGGTR